MLKFNCPNGNMKQLAVNQFLTFWDFYVELFAVILVILDTHDPTIVSSITDPTIWVIWFLIFCVRSLLPVFVWNHDFFFALSDRSGDVCWCSRQLWFGFVVLLLSNRAQFGNCLLSPLLLCWKTCDPTISCPTCLSPILFCDVWPPSCFAASLCSLWMEPLALLTFVWRSLSPQ